MRFSRSPASPVRVSPGRGAAFAALFVIQAARCGVHVREIRERGGVGIALLVKDLLASSGAVWILHSSGALSEADASYVLRRAAASWWLMFAYWASASACGLAPGRNASVAATIASAAAPSLLA